jgi:hypothetical protein
MITKGPDGTIDVPLKDIEQLRADGLHDPIGFIYKLLRSFGFMDETEFDDYLCRLNERLGTDN